MGGQRWFRSAHSCTYSEAPGKCTRRIQTMRWGTVTTKSPTQRCRLLGKPGRAGPLFLPPRQRMLPEPCVGSLSSFMLLFGNLDCDPTADSIDRPAAFPSAPVLEGPVEEEEGDGQGEQERGSFLPAPLIRPKPRTEERLWDKWNIGFVLNKCFTFYLHKCTLSTK